MLVQTVVKCAINISFW